MTITKSITPQSFNGRDFWCLETSQDEKLQERVCFEKSDDIERGKGWLSVLQRGRLQTGPFNEVWSSNRQTIENAIKRFGMDVDRLLGPNPKEKLDERLLELYLPDCFSTDVNRRSCFNRFRGDLNQVGEDDLVNVATVPGMGLEDPSEMVREWALFAIEVSGNKMNAKDVQKIYPLVVKAFRSSSPMIRAKAIGALVALDPERAWQRLTTEGLKDSKEEVRAAACLALGKYADQPPSEKYEEAYQMLLRGAKDSSYSVQASALESLGRLAWAMHRAGQTSNSNRVFDMIEKGIADQDRGIQIGALQGLHYLIDMPPPLTILHALSGVPGTGMLSRDSEILQLAWGFYKVRAAQDDYLSLLQNGNFPLLTDWAGSTPEYVYDEFLNKLFGGNILPAVIGKLIQCWRSDLSGGRKNNMLYWKLVEAGESNVQYRDRILTFFKHDPSYQEWRNAFGLPFEGETPKASSTREEGCGCHAAGEANHQSWTAGAPVFLRRR